MIKRCSPYSFDAPPPRTEEVRENLELMDWAWNSHFWIESYPGYVECKWCGRHHTSEMGINLDFPLCEKNPCIAKFYEERIKRIEFLKAQIMDLNAVIQKLKKEE